VAKRQDISAGDKDASASDAFKIFENIKHRIKFKRVRAICWFGAGEPVCCPYFMRMLA